VPDRLIAKLFDRGQSVPDVEYPIPGGAMSWTSGAGLVSAISNAGGFGVIAGESVPASSSVCLGAALSLP
jgi:enoyl-[acyl-carrier protein] reductase II